tara:strand:+ start:265 stop:513 length:249 start_codon:yes stop_codon:yes gene_type:complete
MESKLEYAEYVTHNGMDLEILGEVFDEPIKKNEVQKFYTRISVINTDTKEVLEKYYFLKENDADELKILVNGIKSNEKYLPK